MLDVAWAPLLGAFRQASPAWRSTGLWLHAQSAGGMHATSSCRGLVQAAAAPPVRSVLFEQYDDNYFVGLCLDGFVSAIRLTSLLDMSMFMNTYVTSLARFTMLHSPAAMKMKHARAFRRAPNKAERTSCLGCLGFLHASCLRPRSAPHLSS